MLCERCHNAVATVHMTQIINGKKSEEHLCPDCAGESGYGWGSSWSDIGDFGWQKLFPVYTPKAKDANPICPLCGTSYQGFLATGKLGCSQCYQTFGDRLKPTIQKIHGSTQHLGKAPNLEKNLEQKKVPVTNRKITKKDKLQTELANLIKEERFEEAAVLRDKIKALDNNSEGVS